MNKCLFSLLGLLQLLFLTVKGQETNMQDSFRNYLEIQESLSFVSLYFDLIEDADQLFPIAEEYLLAAPKAEKRKYYKLILSIGAKAKQESLKRQTISYMLQAYEKEQLPELGVYYLERLTIFHRKLFDKGAKARIRTLLRNEKQNIKELILLIGFLQIKEEKKYLKDSFLSDKQSQFRSNEIDQLQAETWTTYLALARMGDRKAINHVVKKFQDVKDNWNLCRSIASDVDYVRQKKSHQLLVDLALRKEYLHHQDTSSTPCNFYLLPLLLKSTKNYPYERVYYPDIEGEILKWFEGNRKLAINREIF